MERPVIFHALPFFASFVHFAVALLSLPLAAPCTPERGGCDPTAALISVLTIRQIFRQGEELLLPRILSAFSPPGGRDCEDFGSPRAPEIVFSLGGEAGPNRGTHP